MVHDLDPGGIEAEPLLKFPGVEVPGDLGGDVEDGPVGQGPVGHQVDPAEGLAEAQALLLVEIDVVLVLEVLFGLVPDGGLGIESQSFLSLLIFRIVLPSLLLFFRYILTEGNPFLPADFHFDGIADVVGILLDQGTEGVFIQVAGVVLIPLILAEVEDDIGPHLLPVSFLDLIAVYPLADPAVGSPVFQGFGDHFHLFRHHKGSIETDPELADNGGHIPLGLGLLELLGARVGDGPQVLVHLLLGHPNPVVPDGQGSVLFIGNEFNLVGRPVEIRSFLLQVQNVPLIQGIRGVGNQLPEEDILVGINGVNHHIQ